MNFTIKSNDNVIDFLSEISFFMLALPMMKLRGESGYIPGTWTSDWTCKRFWAEQPPWNTSNCPLKAALWLNSNRIRNLEAPNKADLSGKAVGRWRLGSTGM